MNSTLRTISLGWVELFAAVWCLFAAASPAAEPVSFLRDVAPILVDKCQVCHGAEKAKGRYALHTFEAFRKPGDSGLAVFVPGKPRESHLWELLTSFVPEDRMPQKDEPLAGAQLALIERWINEGARFDGSDEKALLSSLTPNEDSAEAPKTYARPLPILAAAFSPRGDELALNGHHEITLWNPETGALLRRIQRLPERVLAIAFSADGSTIAVAGGRPGRDGRVVLVDHASGALLRTLGPMSEVMLDVCFHPTNGKLVAAGGDNAIRIYNPATGLPERVIEQHADWVAAIAFNADGTRLVSASWDKTARVCDPATGSLEATYTEHAGAVAAAVFSVDGKQVFSAGRERKIHAWDASEAKKLGEMGVGDSEVLRLVRDGEHLYAACTDGRVRQFRLKDRSLIRELEVSGDWCEALAVHVASHGLAAGSHDGRVRIWDTVTGTERATFIATPGLRAPAP